MGSGLRSGLGRIGAPKGSFCWIQCWESWLGRGLGVGLKLVYDFGAGVGVLRKNFGF